MVPSVVPLSFMKGSLMYARAAGAAARRGAAGGTPGGAPRSSTASTTSPHARTTSATPASPRPAAWPSSCARAAALFARPHCLLTLPLPLSYPLEPLLYGCICALCAHLRPHGSWLVMKWVGPWRFWCRTLCVHGRRWKEYPRARGGAEHDCGDTQGKSTGGLLMGAQLNQVRCHRTFVAPQPRRGGDMLSVAA